MRKKTFNRIITAGLTIISLFLVFTLKPYALTSELHKYYVLNNSDLYSQLQFKVTQFLQTDETQGIFDGITVSKDFNVDDGVVQLVPSNGNWEFEAYPFLDKWYYDDYVGYYDTAGEWEIEMFIPFADSSGNLFDVAKLNDSAYVEEILLVFNTVLANSQGYVNKRNYHVVLHLANGGTVDLLSQSFDTVAVQTFVLDVDTHFKASEMLGFSFSFRYNGLPQRNTLLEFTIDRNSYVGVTDYSNYGDSSLLDSKDKLTQLQNAMNQPAPDIGSALGNIKSEDMALTGSLFSDSKKGVFYTFLTSLMVVGVSLGLVGYVLHGKK